jgi:hypothetical protein
LNHSPLVPPPKSSRRSRDDRGPLIASKQHPANTTISDRTARNGHEVFLMQRLRQKLIIPAIPRRPGFEFLRENILGYP